MNIREKLLAIQTELKANKGQYNSFGKYNYRSCEDILESVKPLLAKNKATLTITDHLELIGERYYIKAVATLSDCESEESIVNCAYAREEENKKGMDASQVTGATSSYARKYALNGLFCIDDTKDADTDEYAKQNNKDQPQEKEKPNFDTKKATAKQVEMINELYKGKEDKLPKLLEMYKVASVEEFTMAQASDIITKLTKKKEG